MSNGSLRLAFLPSTNLAPLAQYLLQMQGGMKDRKSIATVFTWCHSKMVQPLIRSPYASTTPQLIYSNLDH